MSRVLKVLIIGALLAMLAYGGMCIYGNFAGGTESVPKMPAADEAEFSVRVKSTGATLLTDNYEQLGDVYILHGFWELAGNDFQHRAGDLVLDEAVFGEVKVTRRR